MVYISFSSLITFGFGLLPYVTTTVCLYMMFVLSEITSTPHESYEELRKMVFLNPDGLAKDCL